MNIRDMTPEQLDDLARQVKNEADRKRGGTEVVLTYDELAAAFSILGHRTALRDVEQAGHGVDTLCTLRSKIKRALGFDDGGPDIYWG